MSRNLTSLFNSGLSNVQDQGDGGNPRAVFGIQQEVDSSGDAPELDTEDNYAPDEEDAVASEETFTDTSDLSELPPELQERYRQMQADYTRKTQKVAEDRKTLEQKAQLFDRFSSDPQFRRAYAASFDDSPGQPQVTPGENPYGVNPLDVFDEAERTIPAIKAVAAELFQEQFGPMLDKYKAVVDSLQGNQVRNEWNALVSKYPIAESKLDAVSAFAQRNPGLTLEQALFAVAGPDIAKTPSPPRPGSGQRRVNLGPAGGSSRPKGQKTLETSSLSLAELVRMSREGRLPPR